MSKFNMDSFVSKLFAVPWALNLTSASATKVSNTSAELRLNENFWCEPAIVALQPPSTSVMWVDGVIDEVFDDMVIHGEAALGAMMFLRKMWLGDAYRKDMETLSTPGDVIDTMANDVSQVAQILDRIAKNMIRIFREQQGPKTTSEVAMIELAKARNALLDMERQCANYKWRSDMYNVLTEQPIETIAREIEEDSR